METVDVVVVGGGPAGLSVALVLGRCRRRVEVFDSGEYRNASSHGLHGYLTRDGILPAEFLQIAREQMGRYNTVRLVSARVDEARCLDGAFEVRAAERVLRCRRLVLATGLVDPLPDIPGFAEIYGTSAFHCPFCDGWEMRDEALAVLGPPRRAVPLALELKGWSRDLVVLTHGQGRGGLEAERARLAPWGIPLFNARVETLEQQDGRLEAVRLADGTRLPRRGIFFCNSPRQRSELAQSLGCQLTRKGMVRARHLQSTDVPGLYVVGDASERVQFVIMAAAEGAEAAFAIQESLLDEEAEPGRA